MNSVKKIALTISLLPLLAGCSDYFGWSKHKEAKPAQAEKSEVASHGHVEEKAAGKCSHKGCNHDHSKDHHKKHHDDVKIQDMNDDADDMDMDIDMDDSSDDMDDMADVEVQSMDDDEDFA